jgi:hypothetical protein
VVKEQFGALLRAAREDHRHCIGTLPHAHQQRSQIARVHAARLHRRMTTTAFGCTTTSTPLDYWSRTTSTALDFSSVSFTSSRRESGHCICAARLLVVQIAPALLRLCRASGRAVSPLDFSSIDHTTSHRARGHYVCVAQLLAPGLHRHYCAYAVHPDAPSRRLTSRQSVALAFVVCLVIPFCVVTTRLAAAMHILRLRHASGSLGTSRGSSRGLSRGSSSTTSPTPRVRVPRHVARLVIWLIVDYFASRRLVHRAFTCLGMSCGSSRRSSSTTSPMLRVRVPRHVARLVVDYSVCRDFVLRPHWLYFSHAVHRDYLSRGNTGSTSSTPRTAATSSSGRIMSNTHLD